MDVNAGLKSPQSSQKTVIYQRTYTNLDEITADSPQFVHIYGVVKFASEPKKASRGTSFYMTISLHNDKLFETESRFTVSLFSTFIEELPKCEVGDILRMNNVKIENYRGTVNGKLRLSVNGSWLLFKHDSTAADKWDSASSRLLTWGADERKIVDELRIWLDSVIKSAESPGSESNTAQAHVVSPAAGQPPDHITPSTRARTTNQTKNRTVEVPSVTIATINALDTFVNLKCRLVARYKQTSLTVMKLQDGTTPKLGFKSPALDGFSEESIKALTLPDDFSVYVIAFGKHAKLGNMFELGGCYVFHGVHCKINKSTCVPELYLHETYNTLAEQLPKHETQIIINRTVAELNRIASKPPCAVEEESECLGREEPCDKKKAIQNNCEGRTIIKCQQRGQSKHKVKSQRSAPYTHIRKRHNDLQLAKSSRRNYVVLESESTQSIYQIKDLSCVVDTPDAQITVLKTRLLVTDLPYMSVSQIRDLTTPGGNTADLSASHGRSAGCILVQTTAYLLPLFSVITHRYPGISATGEDEALYVTRLKVRLRDPEATSTTIEVNLPTTLLADSTPNYSKSSTQFPQDYCQILRTMLPAARKHCFPNKATIDSVREVKVIVQIYGSTASISHTLFSLT